MDNIKLFFLVVYRSLKSLIFNVYQLRKGQYKNDMILQIAHRLEKGLCIDSPKPLWGWEKARVLAQLLCDESIGSFEKNTANAVLHAYLQNKRKAGVEDQKKALQFEDEYPRLKQSDYYSDCGGSIHLRKEDLVCEMPPIEKLFKCRHSVRDFEESEVSMDKILKAINMANMCPSACNRQPTHVYIISNKIWNRYTNDPNQVYNANKHLLITANRRAFSIGEINDWIVSASIFTGYLTLSLTAMGIGSCVIKKGLLNDDAYIPLKKHCGILEEEKIIIEIAIGNYKNEFNVPVSNRKTVQQITTIIG